MVSITRGFLTGFLVVCIFRETGIATALFAFLVAGAIEITTLNIKEIRKLVK